MKHTLALVLMVLGLVGCATTHVGETSVSYEELKDDKAMAVNVETGEAFYVSGISLRLWDQQGNYDDDNRRLLSAKAQLEAMRLCDNSIKKEYANNHRVLNSKKVLNSKCKIFKVNDRIIYKDIDHYLARMELFKQDTKSDFIYFDGFSEENRKKREAVLARTNSRAASYNKKQADKKEKILKGLISRCEELGFKGENNISACVQREVQVDLALAKQEEKIDQLENRIDSLAQSRESKTESSSSILVDLLSILADEAERQDDLQQKIRLYKVESEVSTLRSSKNVKQANCSLNRNC